VSLGHWMNGHISFQTRREDIAEAEGAEPSASASDRSLPSQRIARVSERSRQGWHYQQAAQRATVSSLHQTVPLRAGLIGWFLFLWFLPSSSALPLLPLGGWLARLGSIAFFLDLTRIHDSTAARAELFSDPTPAQQSCG
jgi:hypothetical protein